MFGGTGPPILGEDVIFKQRYTNLFYMVCISQNIHVTNVAWKHSFHGKYT